MSMRAAVILGGVILIEQGWSMTTAWANPTQSACALFTIQDINNALSVSVVIDQAVSGPDSRDGDNCVWNSSDGRNVMLRVAPLQDITKAKVAYLVETMNAYGGGKPAEDIKGLADDATYRDYTGTLKGGVLSGRKGSIPFTVEGSPNRETIFGLANTLLSRL